jgi:hypothetical protein
MRINKRAAFETIPFPKPDPLKRELSFPPKKTVANNTCAERTPNPPTNFKKLAFR